MTISKIKLLKIIAQLSSDDYIQQNLPEIIEPRAKSTEIANYNAKDSLGGYWVCPQCNEPVTDENGDIIRDKSDLMNYKPVKAVEEYKYTGLDKDFYINLTQTISNDFSEAISNIDSNDFYDIKDEAYKISENISEKYKIEISKLESDIKAKAKLHQIDPIFPIHNIITCFKYIYNGYDSIKAIILEKIKEVKKRGIEQINSFFDNILDVKEKGQKLEYTVLYPLCYNCSTVCLACGEVVDDIDDMIDYKGNLYCENCAYKCFSCNKVFLNSKKDKFEHAGDVYCEDCFSENFYICEECEDTVNRDDAVFDDDGTVLCSDCYSKQNTIDDYDKNSLRSFVANNENYLSEFYPVDEATIKNKILPFIKNAIKSKLTTGDELLELLGKKNNLGKDAPLIKAIITAEIKDGNNSTDGIYNVFEKQLNKTMELKAKYPNYNKGFKFYPVEVRLEQAHTHTGAVLAIYPTKKFLDLADTIIEGASRAYNSTLGSMGHHRGALAYARITRDRFNNIIVDNLQTDLDTQALEGYNDEPTVMWWAKSINKFWVQYMLNLLRNMGEELGAEVYLTNYDMQKRKWGRIPERNRDVYERIPQEMGFITENVKAKPTELESDYYDMSRLAELFYKLSKKS